MAYLPDFSYDLFISYAHVNNQTADEGEEGWVAQFVKHLEVQLSTLVGRVGVVKLWWDPALDGNQLFDRTIHDRIGRSALFLALTSHGYLASDYCRQELRWFCQKAQAEAWGLSIGDRRRVFNVLLNNIPHPRWPEEYGRTSGHPFHDAGREDEIGYPSDPQEKLFRRQLRTLVEAVYSTLNAFKEAMPKASNQAAAPPANQADHDPGAAARGSCSVFLADTSDSLRPLRRRVASRPRAASISASFRSISSTARTWPTRRRCGLCWRKPDRSLSYMSGTPRSGLTRAGAVQGAVATCCSWWPPSRLSSFCSLAPAPERCYLLSAFVL
jgi:hypothetical protein